MRFMRVYEVYAGGLCEVYINQTKDRVIGGSTRTLNFHAMPSLKKLSLQ